MSGTNGQEKRRDFRRAKIPERMSGFTLLELVISMGVLALLLGAGVISYITIGKALQGELAGTDAAWDVHRAVSAMEDNLRESRQMVTAAPQSVTVWWRDLDGDQSLDSPAETLTYQWDGTVGGDLTVSGARNKIVGRGVQEFQLTYDSGTLALIRLVTARLSLKSQSAQATAEVTVRLRNLP